MIQCTYNYFEFIDLLKKAFLSHPFINEFYYGVWSADEAQNIKYPCVVVTTNNITAGSQTDVASMNILYADRLTPEEDNILQIHSVSQQVIREVLNAISEYYEVDIDEGYVITPFTRRFADIAAGCNVTLDIESASSQGDCYALNINCLDC